MSNDFPFNNWNDYYLAFTLYLSTPFYYKKFPKYYEFHKLDNCYSEFTIISQLLETGLNPQEGLNGFMNAIIEGVRYAGDIKHEIPKIMEIFIEKGAVVNVDRLFERQYESEQVTFEDEVVCYTVRGLLIDALAEIIHFDVMKYADWKSLKATYWEDIRFHNNFTDTERLMYLKYCSDYLQTFE